MAYKLEKPYMEKQRVDFIVEYNHNQGLFIEETELALFALEENEIMQEGEPIIDPEYEEKQAEKEEARILELSMTRGDFFNGTIYAWGADEDDLKPVIEQALTALQFTDLEKKGAMNYYKNALNFYRKHPLFAMLTDVAIPLTETTFVTVTKDEWNKFFDEVNKQNQEAYKELPAPQEIVTTEENTEVEEVVVSEMETTTEENPSNSGELDQNVDVNKMVEDTDVVGSSQEEGV